MNKDNHLIYEAYTVQEEGLKDIIKGAGAAAAIGLGSMVGANNLTASDVANAAIEKPIGEMDPKMDREFVEYIKSTENAGKTGFKNGRWYPHDSYEGGTDTIGYGHKLGETEKYPQGISNSQAENFLKRDLMNAENLVKQKIGKEYENLDMKRKQMFIDFAYNLGSKFTTKFPKFTRAALANDINGMIKEYERSAKGKKLTRRNEMFFNLFLKDRQFVDPSKGKKDSEETSVIVKQGDTFTKIANIQRVNVNDLMKANPGVDPKKLQIGQELNLP